MPDERGMLWETDERKLALSESLRWEKVSAASIESMGSAECRTNLLSMMTGGRRIFGESGDDRGRRGKEG